MSRLLDRFTDGQIMAMLVQRDFSAINNVFEDDEITVFGRGLYNYVNPDLTLRFPNLTHVNPYAFYNVNVKLEINFEKLEFIGDHGFYYFKGTGMPEHLKLTNAVTLQENAFMYAPTIVTLEAPAIVDVYMPAYLFSCISTLTKVKCQNLERPGQLMFFMDANLIEADLPSFRESMNPIFNNCTKLETVRLGGYTIGSLAGLFTQNCSQVKTIILDHISNIPAIGDLKILPKMTDGTCKVYVPRDMVTTLRAADNWKDYAGQILAIEDHPEVMPTWDD